MEQIFNRFLFLLICLCSYCFMFVLFIPCLLIGMPIYVLRWILTGKTNGLFIYFGAPLEFFIILICILEYKMNITDDKCFANTTLWKELKFSYNND